MNADKTSYTSFSLDWTIRSTKYLIRYRKTFEINEIDEIFCTIIHAKGSLVRVSELGDLLGLNLQDLAETAILNIYLKGLIEYNLIQIDQATILLTEFGQEALQSKLKYKYYDATTELFESLTATGEHAGFSFRKEFNLENNINIIPSLKYEHESDSRLDLKQKLQFQLFENDIYHGEIIALTENNPGISYKNVLLQCDITELDSSFQISIYNSGVSKPEIVRLIDLPENARLKMKLIREGMFHQMLASPNTITAQDVKKYIDLWNWKELAGNPKVDWHSKEIFQLFRQNGDGSIWNIISEKVPVENIKAVVWEYADYWNWTTLTQRIDNNFIQEQIEELNWDFEELSYKEPLFVTSLLSKQTLKERDWDWDYLSRKLPNDFIEDHIEDFPWNFYSITEERSDILRNLLRKSGTSNSTYAGVLHSKQWNWAWISSKSAEKFLYENILSFAAKIDWHIVLNRFFNDPEIIAKCLNDESFKTNFARYLPGNYIAAHQKYLWTKDLIDFFEQQNLIQWESTPYIRGFDTNGNVEWSREVFEKYHERIITEKGYANISQLISDYTLIEAHPDFAWNWEGVSKNKNLANNVFFVENAFSGKLPFSDKLFWDEILLNTTYEISFWNKHLNEFYNSTDEKDHVQFWKAITKKERQEYIFENAHLPWNWNYITESSTTETILKNFNDRNIFEKWDWKIATPKIPKEVVLDELEYLTHVIDWDFVIIKVFAVDDELSLNGQLPRIAACLSALEAGKRKEIWRVLTAIYPFETLFSYVRSTYELDEFEWDWDVISIHSLFPTDLATIGLYRQKINWSAFSNSSTIKNKFNPSNWDTPKEWFNNTDQYLARFKDYWDWQVLSENRNINNTRNIVKKYKDENWNWEYLSEFGGFLTKLKKDNDDYLNQIIYQFPKIRFDFLSKRKDIVIDEDLITITENKNWDWQILSGNEKAAISGKLLLKLKEKSWDWKAVSRRKDIYLENEIILNSLDKDWDWVYLSENKDLVFNAEFIGQTKLKQWDWRSVSRHKSFLPTIEMLTLCKDFDLDWPYLSKKENLNPTRELLAKFENKWDWHFITANPNVNFADVDFIERFADKWDWDIICESGKLTLSNDILNRFRNLLKWNLISANTNIDFTRDSIQQFRSYWNWTILKENKRIEELLGDYVAREIINSATLTFIDKIETQYSPWKRYIYHFSHIDNAIEIIRSRKIQSRNNAIIRGDAAGNVVHLRSEAHDYARFYFRPHTPTQFYNEYLGKNTTDGYESKESGWVSWYEKARSLGFPKCPVPIFFKFSLQEVLFKNERACCISNGNMQTNSTTFGSIDSMINKFSFDELFFTPSDYATKEDFNRYRNYAQQEFLVKDGLSFNDLTDFQIVCPSDADKRLLLRLLGEEHKELYSRIVVNRNYYNNENPRVRIEEEGSELHISTTFKGNGYFLLSCSKGVKELEILTGDVSKMDKDKIFFNSYVSIRSINQSMQLNFIDESDRDWFVYAR